MFPYGGITIRGPKAEQEDPASASASGPQQCEQNISTTAQRDERSTAFNETNGSKYVEASLLGRVQQLQEENRRLRRVNQVYLKHLTGRAQLLYLPKAVQEDIFTGPDAKELLVEQLITVLHMLDKPPEVEWFSRHFDRLASLPDGGIGRAIAFTIMLGNKATWQLGDPAYQPHRHSHVALDKQLLDLVSRRWSSQTDGEEWDPWPLIDRIREIRKPYVQIITKKPHEDDNGHCRVCDRYRYRGQLKHRQPHDNYFKNTLYFLYVQHQTRVMKLLSMRVAGHALPAELVAPIRDYLCDDMTVREVKDSDSEAE